MTVINHISRQELETISGKLKPKKNRFANGFRESRFMEFLWFLAAMPVAFVLAFLALIQIPVAVLLIAGTAFAGAKGITDPVLFGYGAIAVAILLAGGILRNQ